MAGRHIWGRISDSMESETKMALKKVADKKELKIWIDGKLYPKSKAKISVFDHGLLYGDGIFEGIRVYNGKIFLPNEHYDRLFEGAHYINLKIPYTKAQLIKHTETAVKANGIVNGYIRLIVTRGFGDLGLDPGKCKRPTVIIIAAGIKLYPTELYEKGMAIITAAVPAIHAEALNPRVKTLNYLNNILAKMEALRAGVHEAIMLNSLGDVAECSGDNIFIVKKGVVKTPPATAHILEGCTRNAVLKLARGGDIPAIETTLQRYDLYTADECFLTGSGAEIIPVIEIDGRKIGSGKPGPVTKDLLRRFRDYIKSVC